MFDLRRLFLRAGLVSLALVYPLLWLRMISTPSERTGSDFIAFYAAGRVARQEEMAKAYDPVLQQAVQEEQVGFPLVPGQVLLYNHVPYLLPVLFLLAGRDYVASFLGWAALLLTVFSTGILLLARLLKAENWPRADILAAVGGMLVFYPFFVGLMNGQDTAFTTLGLCLLVFSLMTGREWLAGLGLALTTIRPQLAVFFALPFLFRGWRVFAWFCIGCVGLGLVSFLSLGPSGLTAFVDLLLVSASGEWYGLKEPVMVNLIGLLWRLFPSLGGETIRWIGWAAYLLALAGMCLFWRRSSRIETWQLGLLVVVAVFISPHLHYHDLSLLLIPIFLLMVVRTQRGGSSTRLTSLIPLVFSLSFLFSGFSELTRLNAPYIFMLVMTVLLWPVSWPGNLFPGKKP